MLKATSVSLVLALCAVLLSGCNDDKPKDVVVDEVVDLAAGQTKTFGFDVEKEGTRVVEYTSTHGSGSFAACLMIKPKASEFRDGKNVACAPNFGCGQTSLYAGLTIRCMDSPLKDRIVQVFDGGDYVVGVRCDGDADACGVRVRVLREDAEEPAPEAVDLASGLTITGSQLVVDIDARRDALAIVAGSGDELGAIRMQGLKGDQVSACLFDGSQQERYEDGDAPVCLLSGTVAAGQSQRLLNELPGLRYGLLLSCQDATDDCSVSVKLEADAADAAGSFTFAATSPGGAASHRLPFADTLGIDARRRAVEAVLVQGGERLNWNVENLGSYNVVPQVCIFEDQFSERYQDGEAVPCEWSGAFSGGKGFVDLSPGWYGIGYECGTTGTTDCTVYRHVWLEKTEYLAPDKAATTAPSGADIEELPIDQTLTLSSGRSWLYSFRVDKASVSTMHAKLTANRTAQAQVCLLQDADRDRADEGQVVKCFYKALVGNADYSDELERTLEQDLQPGWYTLWVSTTKTSPNATMRLALDFTVEEI